MKIKTIVIVTTVVLLLASAAWTIFKPKRYHMENCKIYPGLGWGCDLVYK